ncbi:MAG TPA: hypothetical protein VM581_02060 [Magnetospirillaceae bacterium]|nr:hypothetical protein [Magnetospirillaceae bacterium]
MPLHDLPSYAANRRICLPRISGVFGLPWVEGDDKANAATFNEAFVGPEHGILNIPVTQVQLDAARGDLVALGFAEPHLPALGTFGNTYGLGAVNPANARRSRLVRDMEADGYDLGDLYLLTGQRRLEKRDGDPMELLAGINRDVLAHPWVERHIAGRPWEKNWSVTEFHVWVGIELAIEPALELEECVYFQAGTDTLLPDVPRRHFQEVRLRRPNGKLVVVNNAPAIERWDSLGKPADPRHTTISCTLDLLARHPELLQTGADELYISGNPHAERMVDDSRRALTERGRRPSLHLAATSLPSTHERFVQLSLHELGMREHNAYLL